MTDPVNPHVPYKVTKPRHLQPLPVGSVLLLDDQGYATVAVKNLTYSPTGNGLTLVPKWFTSDPITQEMSNLALFERWNEARVIHIPPIEGQEHDTQDPPSTV